MKRLQNGARFVARDKRTPLARLKAGEVASRVEEVGAVGVEVVAAAAREPIVMRSAERKKKMAAMQVVNHQRR